MEISILKLPDIFRNCRNYKRFNSAVFHCTRFVLGFWARVVLDGDTSGLSAGKHTHTHTHTLHLVQYKLHDHISSSDWLCINYTWALGLGRETRPVVFVGLKAHLI